jgi:hypothetical protein
LPIYFQSIQGVSATQSGVRFIALVCPQIVSLVVVGAIVSSWGYYVSISFLFVKISFQANSNNYQVPFIVTGIAICSIGAGLITTITVGTQTVRWATYLIVYGIGIGAAQQLPYTTLQAVLDPIDVATGNAIAVFSFQLGGALGVAIAQNLFLNKLLMTVPEKTSAVTPQMVVAVGATGLVSISHTDEILLALRETYAAAIRYTLILALSGACAAFPFAWGMEWLNIKNIAKARQSGRSELDEIELKGNAQHGMSKKVEATV